MSHVDIIELDINDLDALKAAGRLCGLELVKQETYRWYGKHMGDYPLPAGFKREDLGHCDFVLRLPGKKDAYEVGIVKRKDGKPGYVPLWDFWNGGYGLEDAVGKNGSKLKQEYALQVATKEMARKGWRTERVINPATQKPRLRAWRG